MAKLAEQAKEFLAQKRIAVAGVTREQQSTKPKAYIRHLTDALAFLLP